MKKPKVLVILGPTASGKSNLAVQLARRFNGEVISADSRQVYKDLNLGTGKITKKEMSGVPHYLLDVVSPKKRFTVVDFKEVADERIVDIISRGKLPIICGGTGFYIQAVVDNVSFPEVKENKKLRARLSKISTDKLYLKLIKLDPKRARTIDPNNKIKIIRALEIASALGKVPKLKTKPLYETLQIGITTPDSTLKKKISARLTDRMKKGMVKEVKQLHQKGLSWKRMNELGLEYRYLSLFLQNKMTKTEMLQKLATEIWQYARRQKTWFRRDKRIKWFELKNQKKIEKGVKEWLAI